MPSPAEATLDPAGEPDLGFDGDAATRTNMATVDTFAEARGVGFQHNGERAGKVVLVGGFQDGFDFHVALLRLNSDGTQDTSFGTRGEVKTVLGGNDLAEDAASQADDKIVGNDRVHGAAGDDTLLGGGNTDTCLGGVGTDQATACERTIGIP